MFFKKIIHKLFKRNGHQNKVFTVVVPQEDYIDLLEFCFVHGHSYRLAVYQKIADSDIYEYRIELLYLGEKDPIWIEVRSFSDADKEYAKNCAYEAFEYLTKSI